MCISLVDICLGRKVRWITTDILVIRILVDADIIDFHRRRENEIVEVGFGKTRRYAQVHDDVLSIDMRKVSPQHSLSHHFNVLTIGSCDIGRADISTALSAPMPAEFNCHANWSLAIHAMYL